MAVKEVVEALQAIEGAFGAGERLSPGGGAEVSVTFEDAPVVLVDGPGEGLDVPNRVLGPADQDAVRQVAEDNGSVVVPVERPRLPVPDANRVDESARENGIDVLAWYRSFHFGSWNWGIFIRQTALIRLRERLVDATGCELDDAHDAAYDLLRGHEYFHHLADIAATLEELAVNAPLYRSRLEHQQRQTPGYSVVEEALANEYALRQVRAGPLRIASQDLLREGPAGYRDFGQYRTPKRRVLGRRTLLGEILSFGVSTSPVVLGELLFNERKLVTSPEEVPTFIVLDGDTGASGLFFVPAIQKIEETDTFKKDLSKLAKAGTGVVAKWAKARAALAQSTRTKGLNFEKLRGATDKFSVRLSREIRVILELDDGEWTAIGVGRHELYKS